MQARTLPVPLPWRRGHWASAAAADCSMVSVHGRTAATLFWLAARAKTLFFKYNFLANDDHYRN